MSCFTQPDTIVPNPANPQDLNRYSYVVNNPATFSDPTGHDYCANGGGGCGGVRGDASVHYGPSGTRVEGTVYSDLNGDGTVGAGTEAYWFANIGDSRPSHERESTELSPEVQSAVDAADRAATYTAGEVIRTVRGGLDHVSVDAGFCVVVCSEVSVPLSLRGIEFSGGGIGIGGGVDVSLHELPLQDQGPLTTGLEAGFGPHGGIWVNSPIRFSEDGQRLNAHGEWSWTVSGGAGIGVQGGGMVSVFVPFDSWLPF